MVELHGGLAGQEIMEMSVTTITELYERTISHLPAADRLRLAALILQNIPERAVVDYSEEWSDEDLRDFSASSWAHIDRAFEMSERG